MARTSSQLNSTRSSSGLKNEAPATDRQPGLVDPDEPAVEHFHHKWPERGFVQETDQRGLKFFGGHEMPPAAHGRRAPPPPRGGRAAGRARPPCAANQARTGRRADDYRRPPRLPCGRGASAARAPSSDTPPPAPPGSAPARRSAAPGPRARPAFAV